MYNKVCYENLVVVFLYILFSFFSFAQNITMTISHNIESKKNYYKKSKQMNDKLYKAYI